MNLEKATDKELVAALKTVKTTTMREAIRAEMRSREKADELASVWNGEAR